MQGASPPQRTGESRCGDRQRWPTGRRTGSRQDRIRPRGPSKDAILFDDRSFPKSGHELDPILAAFAEAKAQVR